MRFRDETVFAIYSKSNPYQNSFIQGNAATAVGSNSNQSFPEEGQSICWQLPDHFQRPAEQWIKLGGLPFAFSFQDGCFRNSPRTAEIGQRGDHIFFHYGKRGLRLLRRSTTSRRQ